MQLIALLVALLIVGFLVTSQLDSSSSNTEHEDAVGHESITVPDVPTDPASVQKFEKDINEFMKDSEDQRKKAIEESLNN